jgi:hypothetical protein
MIALGISGVARSGKDTLCAFLIKKFKEKGKVAKRYALADTLKEKLSFLIKGEFDIDVYNCTDEQKQLIRPLLVAFGAGKRKMSDGTYWTNHLAHQIIADMEKGVDIAIITDIRYAEYEKDELYWLRELLRGILIHVEKIIVKDGVRMIAPPPNEDEAKNDPIIKSQANIKLVWEDKSIPNSNADQVAEELFNSLCPILKI